jgi:hypothetical protein
MMGIEFVIKTPISDADVWGYYYSQGGLDIVPAVGSPRWDALSDDARDTYVDIASRACILCRECIGELFWFRGTPTGFVHVDCVEGARKERVRNHRIMLGNPFLQERAAKLAGCTIAGFQYLPLWERMRFLREAESSV